MVCVSGSSARNAKFRMLSDGTFHETLEIRLMKIVVSVDLQLRLLIPCSLRQRNLLGRPDPSLLVFNLVLACYGTQSVKIVQRAIVQGLTYVLTELTYGQLFRTARDTP